MLPRSFRIRISGPKIWSAPTKTDLPYNFCFINNFPSLMVAAVDTLQTLFRAPWPQGQNIAYDLALVKLGPHTKFGEDWSNGVDFYTGHTHTHTQTHTHRFNFIYKMREVACFRTSSFLHTPIYFFIEKYFKYVFKISDSLFHQLYPVVSYNNLKNGTFEIWLQ